MLKTNNRSAQRLLKDLQEIKLDPHPYIFAEPKEDNLYEWHVNLLPPKDSPYEGGIFHLHLHFPTDYPLHPPKVELKTTVTRSHVGSSWICLDLLETHYTNEMYTGWSTSYSTLSILVQLQSYLFDEDEKWYEDIYDSETLEKKKKQNAINSLNFSCTCGHSPSKNKFHPKIKSKIISNGFKKEITTKNILEAIAKIKPYKVVEQEPIQEYIKVQVKTPIIWKPLDQCDDDLSNVNPYRHSELGWIGIIGYGKKTMTPMSNNQKSLPSVYYHSETNSLFSCYISFEEKKVEIQPLPKLKKNTKSIELPNEVWIEIFEFLDVRENKRIFASIPELEVLSSPYLIERRETLCYHRKLGIHEDILGFGIKINYHPYIHDKIDTIVSPLEILSISAFKEDKVRKSVWRDTFEYWMPLYIHPTHGEIALPFIEETVKIIFKKNFKPELAVLLLSKLMNSQIVETMKGKIHASIKALDGYFYFHRLLIAIVQKYPEELEKINQKVKNFISNEKYRSKEHVENLGDFLALLSVSNYEWCQVSPYILNEVLCRNVQWIIKDHYNVESFGEKKFLNSCFHSTKVSRNLIMFHAMFLRCFARPRGKSLKEIAHNYDLKYGRSTLEEKETFQEYLFSLEKVDTWSEYFRVISVKTKMSIIQVLQKSFIDSERRGYHKKRF